MQVWANCRLFNQDGSDIVRLANSLEADFRAHWLAASLPSTVTPSVGIRLAVGGAVARGAKRSAVKRKRYTGTSSESEESDPGSDVSESQSEAESERDALGTQRKLTKRQEAAVASAAAVAAAAEVAVASAAAAEVVVASAEAEAAVSTSCIDLLAVGGVGGAAVVPGAQPPDSSRGALPLEAEPELVAFPQQQRRPRLKITRQLAPPAVLNVGARMGNDTLYQLGSALKVTDPLFHRCLLAGLEIFEACDPTP